MLVSAGKAESLPAALSDTDDRIALYLRLALAVAILSCVFEKSFELDLNLALGRDMLIGATAALAVAAVLAIFERTSQAAAALFGVATLVYVSEVWAAYHNHGWLSLWTIPVAAVFGTFWWQSDLYRRYLRATLGAVMLGACAQKLLAGTYLDGSYITFLSLNGSPTERLFGPLCGPDAAAGSCVAHRVVGTFIVVWQAVVGVLLIAGVKHLAFLFIEIAFLLGAGLYADEMNFQVLNIALLAIAFGYGMRPWLLAVSLALLGIDAIGLNTIAGGVAGGE